MSAWYWGPFSYKGSTGGSKNPIACFCHLQNLHTSNTFKKKSHIFLVALLWKEEMSFTYIISYLAHEHCQELDRVVVLWGKRHKGNLSKGGGRYLLYLICCGTCQPLPSLSTNSILFCWLFTIKDWCKKVCFCKHTIKVCVSYFKVSWDLCP